MCPEPSPSESDPNAPLFLIDGNESSTITFIYCGEFKLTAYGFIKDDGYTGGINETKVTSIDGQIELPLGLVEDIRINGTGYITRFDISNICPSPYVSKIGFKGNSYSFSYQCGPGKQFIPVENYIEKVVAADLDILPLDSSIYLPELCGSATNRPCYRQAYRAYLQVRDEGGSIKGNRLDIFAGIGPGENSSLRGSSPIYNWVANHSYLGTTKTFDGRSAIGPTPVYQLVNDDVIELIIKSLICKWK